MKEVALLMSAKATGHRQEFRQSIIEFFATAIQEIFTERTPKCLRQRFHPSA
jgi:hypothetical protein